MKEILKQLFHHANYLMLTRDLSEINRDVSERSTCANLKEMISLLLPYYDFNGYYADVEYNRAGEGDVKQTLVDGIPDNIVSDLIVHSRGEKIKDNLLCIEMKKSYATKSAKKGDKDRLKALTSHSLNIVNNGRRYVADYELGIYYEININKKIIIFDYYVNGHFFDHENISFTDYIDKYRYLGYPYIWRGHDKNSFCFHNVGQGLFYSGSLNYKEFNFIYDCGSKSVSQINSAVKNICLRLDKKCIDFLVISHFHFDHISGIEELRKHVTIGRVFVPYLFEDKDLTYLAIWGAVNINGENDVTSNSELVNYLYGLYYSDQAIKVRDEKTFQTHNWVFKFYNKIIGPSKALSLETMLKNKLKLRGYSSVHEIVNKGDIDDLKNIYFAIFGSGNTLNDTSLILLHYPEDEYHRFLGYHKRGICDPFSLLTGDMKFDPIFASNVASGYPDRICGIGLIPHHGSKYNWNRFYSSFSTIDYYVVSSGLKYAPKFPDPIIARTLPLHNYIKVNEMDDFQYFIF